MGPRCDLDRVVERVGVGVLAINMLASLSGG